jgi:hypothetical protein
VNGNKSFFRHPKRRRKKKRAPSVRSEEEEVSKGSEYTENNYMDSPRSSIGAKEAKGSYEAETIQ